MPAVYLYKLELVLISPVMKYSQLIKAKVGNKLRFELMLQLQCPGSII